MEFFSEKELIAQTGHSRCEWHLVFIKECVDNALDACEEADVAPVINVVCDAGGITVSDNGPGIPDSTVEGAIDFNVRCSSREAYVAPDRGAQGNTLMSLVAMPYVINDEAGRLFITSQGNRREIFCRVDPVTQSPIVELLRTEVLAGTGTSLRIDWPEEPEEACGEIPWPILGSCGRIYDDDEKLEVQRLIWGLLTIQSTPVDQIHMVW